MAEVGWQEFDLAMCRIVNKSEERYRDWTLWPHNGCLIDLLLLGNHCLIPYEFAHLGKFMYFSGGFWVGRREFMLANPVNEELMAGQGEDVEWSMRVRNFARLTMVRNAKVVILKDKNPIMSPISRLARIILGSKSKHLLIRVLSIQIPPNIIAYVRKLYDFRIRVKRRMSRRVLAITNSKAS
jgi:hypothetical protein